MNTQIVPTVEGALPPPDVAPALANAEKMVNAVYRALPNTRWGSSRDDFCYRRCAGHVSNAKQALLKVRPLVARRVSRPSSHARPRRDARRHT